MAIVVTTKTPVTEIKTSSALSGGEVTGDNETAYVPLVDVLINSRFKFSDQSRQKITADVKQTAAFKPFQLFEDGKQANKQFIVTGFTMDVLNDKQTIEFTEYGT